MAIYQFPDLETLRFALTSGAIPLAAAIQNVAAVCDGETWNVQSSVAMDDDAVRQLRALGVAVDQGDQIQGATVFQNWLQLLPAKRSERSPNADGRSAVLFVLAKTTILPQLVAEILRLGNDRQSYQIIRHEEDEIALLRVYGPPYYSLLQAVDHEIGNDGIQAFTEVSEGVWVQLGWSHDFQELIKAPDGQLLLIQPDRKWDLLPQLPFHDIYEILEFPIAQSAVQWIAGDVANKSIVPLQLTRSVDNRPAELWVIETDGQQQMESFVRHATEELLIRLLFGVGRRDGKEVIVVRARPSRSGPPELALDAAAYCPAMHLPNLFLPTQTRIHPPIRRDTLRRLLTPDLETIVWLTPTEDGGFVPNALPDSDFRPLTEWVDYVISREAEPLQSWVAATVFDFDEFVCDEERQPREKKPSDKSKNTTFQTKQQDNHKKPSGPVTSDVSESPQLEDLEELPDWEPSELQNRQREVEANFLQSDAPLDDPERRAQWLELARIYAVQDNGADASICWTCAAWISDDAQPLYQQWRDYACRDRGRTAGRVIDAAMHGDTGDVTALRRVAAVVLNALPDSTEAAQVRERQGSLQHWLERNDRSLPVKTVWLVAEKLAALAGDDALALARVRDRLLERLFQSSMTMDLDLPSFLRFGDSGGSGIRASAIHDWYRALPKKVHQWIDANTRPMNQSAAQHTHGYAGLMLAFGMARMGEAEACRRLTDQARRQLTGGGDVEATLLEAFTYRIDQAAVGVAEIGELPEHVLEYLDQMERTPRYAVDRLRQRSDILEPNETINPYRQWWGATKDELHRALINLVDVRDKRQLQESIETLRKKYVRGRKAKSSAASILQAALELGPRIGESFAIAQLQQVESTLERVVAPMARAELLEQALFVAAHFDQTQFLTAFVARFDDMLRHLREAGDPADMDSLADKCFRGLRKFGLRDAIHRLLANLAEALTHGNEMEAMRSRDDWAKRLRSLLRVAAGWYYFDADDDAKPIIDEARRLLYTTELPRGERLQLVIAYIQCLGQAPAHFAVQAIGELLDRLTEVNDAFTTSAYYALSQLQIVESIVLAVVNEEFTVGAQVRRWLDDEEFGVRRRIHDRVRR